MAFRYRNLRRISALFSGRRFHGCGHVNNLSASSLIPLAYTPGDIDASGVCRVMHASRFSTVAARSTEVSCELDLISFIRSTFDLAEGPHHCWINRFEGSKEFLQKDGAYLLLADAFLDNPPGSRGDRIVMLEKVKLLQQRYPWLQVFGFQSCSSVSSMVDHNILTDVIMEEYISFPILLSSKNFPEVASGACCVLFKGLNNPQLYNENDVDLSILHKAIKDLNKQLVHNTGNVGKLKSPWSKKTEGFKEPYICSYLQNLPLFLPACISTDEQGNRFFLSDSNHHRVIVFDRTGKILDVIGSSPGCDDGDFETAKLMRPAASWYHASEDCLYLVDSEMFILPMHIMDRIQAICRNFLWEGHDGYSKAPLVAWAVLCKEKKRWGLGFIDSRNWNIAAIGKLVWWIMAKKDHLWIKCIASIYLKNRSWMNYEPTPNSSWAWCKICEVKNILSGYIGAKWRGQNADYSISDGYKWFMSGSDRPVGWRNAVWNRYNIPKHLFICWLIKQEHLLTLDRLYRMGISCEETCYICGQGKESHQHLFQECSYAAKCFELLTTWLQVPWRSAAAWGGDHAE